MHVIRRPARQAHAIPSTAGYPVGPFNPEVLAQPEIVVETPELKHEPPRLKLYQCNYCGETVTEDEIDAHWCDG